MKESVFLSYGRSISVVFFTVAFMCIGAFFYNKPVSASVPAANYVWKTTTMTYPRGVAVSPYDGNLYIATSVTSGNLIQEWTSAGVLVHTWGAYGTAAGQLKGAYDIAIDSSGNIYIVEYGNHRIQKFDSSHTLQWTVGGTSYGSGNSQFFYPEGIGVDNAGNVYVADSMNDRVQIFNSTTGAYISQFATGGVRHFNNPTDVAFDASGNIYVVDTYNNVIQKFNSSRVFVSEFGTYGNVLGKFNYPRGIAIDSTGNIYVADTSNNRIQKFTSSFESYNPIGSSGSGNGYFNYPYKIALGSDTTFYVADSSNNRVQKFDLSGFNYQVSNLTASLNVLDSLGTNIELGESNGVNNASAVLRLQTPTGIVLSDVTVDMTVDRDWTSVNGDSDRTTSKAFVSSLIGAPGVSASHTLYVPIPVGMTSESVIICPDATSLASVTIACTNVIEHGVGTFTESWGDITITKEAISGYVYWKITGMKGSGGMAYDLVVFTGLGAGTVGDPYQITTCVELQEMKDNLAAYFSIMNSIDCSATSGWNGGLGFTPIGADGNTPFSGHLTGNASYTISGLYIKQAVALLGVSIGDIPPCVSYSGINSPTPPYTTSYYISPPSGLFGCTSGAEISEVHLTNLSIVLSDSAGTVGGLVAHMLDGSIDNSSVGGSILQTCVDLVNGCDYIEYVGGMIGMTEGTTNITGSTTDVSIALSNDVYESGGFIGMSTDTTLIEDCSASGDLTVGIDSYANGGFVGDMEGDTTILRSNASGDVSISQNADVNEGDSYDNGGFVGGMGWIADRHPGFRLISDSYATGDVIVGGEDNWDIGGFVGCLYDGGTIENSYATGDITAAINNIAVGGFVGLTRNRWLYADPVISSSYATGNIITDYDSYDIGGFVGEHRDGPISDSYATGNITLGSANNEGEWVGEAGGFVGYMDHYTAATSSSIIRSYSTGSIDSYGEAESLGGFVGGTSSSSANLLIDECYSLGSYVKGAYTIGGFVGYLNGSLNLIRNSYSRTDVISRYYDETDPTGADAETGGFVGYQGGGTIQNSYSTGSGEGITNLISGVNTTLTSTIDDIATSMTVSNASGIVPGGYLEIDVYTGSLFNTTLSESSGNYANHIHVVDASGFTAGDTITIGGWSNCVIGSIDGITINFVSGSMTYSNYSAGATVTIAAATEIEDVLVGSVNGNVLTITRAMGNTYSDIHPAGSVVHSFAFNPITGGLGGFAGYSGGTITSSYWDMEASGLDSSYGGTGLTTSQLKTQSNLIGWDFDTVWSIYSGNNDGYPALDQIIWTNYDCSGSCESGATCNQYGNPPQGKMWACRLNGSVYKCLFDDINAGGGSCYLNCNSGWQSCGCNQSACESACTAEHANDGYGHFTHTDTCDGCGQLFTCGCDNIPPATPTPTISPTPTIVRPINDDFVNAINIGNDAVINASNVNATTEVAEYTSSAYFSHTVWWKLHAASVYSLTVSLCGSNYDTYLSVGTGTAVDNYTPVAQNDDSCGVQSVVTFNTVEGTDYYIQVGGYSQSVGNIVLTITGMPYVAPTDTPTPTPTSVPSNLLSQGKISSGMGTACAITSTGGVKCWGQHQPWDNNMSNISLLPVDVPGLTSGVDTVGTGWMFDCALTTAGGVKCWGQNESGEIGNGTIENVVLGVTNVTGLTSGVKAIAVGGAHACALLDSGAVKCWGSNGYGQIGDGFQGWENDRSVPTEVIGLSSGVEAISAGGGGSTTCALLDTGGVKCWGYNYNGQIGDGTDMNSKLEPTQVSGLTSGVIGIAVSGNNSCAISTGGSLKCWGANSYGQIGDGTTSQRDTPTEVIGLSSGVRGIGVGSSHTCAVTSSEVYCWGTNYFYESGSSLGWTTNSSPILVNGLSVNDIIEISLGSNYSCVVIDSFALECFGSGGYGRLAFNSETDYYTPVTYSTTEYTGSVTINNGDSSTNSSPVSLAFSADGTVSYPLNPTGPVANITQMIMCEDVGFNGCDYQAYSSSVSFGLTPYEETKTIYVKFKDTLGNESQVFSDNIYYASGITTTPTPTPTFYVSDTLTRLKADVPSDHTITFNTINGLTESGNTIVVNMVDWDISNLTVSDLRLSTDNTILSLDDTPGVNTWGVTFEAGVITLTAPTTGSGYISAGSGITLKIGVVAGGINQPVNPESVGSYRIFVTNNTPSSAEVGEASIPIVDSDQVNITGFVSAFMTFDIDTGTNDEVDCASNECKIHGGTGAAPGDNYTVDLGELKSTYVNKSNDVGVMHSDGILGIVNSIYFDLTTNALTGAVITVSSASEGLQGPDTKISSVTDGEDITNNSGFYGFNLPVESAQLHGTIVKNSLCESAGAFCGPTLDPKEVFNTANHPVDGARIRMDIAAAVAYTNTPGAYTDTLTFIATATF